MKIDFFSEIIYLQDSIYLYNNRTGGLNIIDDKIKAEFIQLKKENVFSPEKAKISGSKIAEFMKSGHIHNLSRSEFKREKDVFLEKIINTSKLRNKTPSLIIHPHIFNKWCSVSQNDIQKTAIELGDFMRNLDLLKKYNYNKINLWIDFSYYKYLIEFFEVIKSKKFNINSFYIHTNIENYCTIISELRKVINYKFDLLLKSKTSANYNLYSIGKKTIDKKTKMIFHCQDQYLFCPMIYNTFFLNEKNQVHFCPIELNNKKNKNSINSKKIEFKKLCKKNDCKYEYYCFAYCSKLIEIYNKNPEPFSSNDCKVAEFINNQIKNKLNIILNNNKDEY